MREGTPKRIVVVLMFGAFVIAPSISHAQSISSYFSYQGRAFDTNGTSPLLRTVDFKIQIRSSNGACLLYEELQTGLNLSSTNGYFALNLGSNSGDSKRTANDPSLSMSRIFSNTGTVRSSASDCVGGYTPASGDKRRLRITIIDNGTPTTLTPDQEIHSVPYATVAESLQGVSAAGFIQVSGAVTQQNLSDLLAKKSELLSLAANEAALTTLAMGSSTVYLKPSAGGANFTGAGNISLASQKSLQLGAYTNTQQGAFVSALVASDKGKTWFNTDTNMIMYWDGASVKALGSATAITSFNGSTQVAQSLSVGSAGTTPAWATDAATGVHTLNLPLASSVGVTAGLLSYTDYSALAPKTYCDAKLGGQNLTAPSSAEDGKSLRWNNSTQAWEYFTPESGADYLAKTGNLSGLANAGTARANLGLTSTGDALATASNASAARSALGLGGAAVLEVGTASGTVAAGNDARIDGSLQQTAFNGYVAGASGANACTSGQSMYWNSVSNQFACSSIGIAASQITSGTIASARMPAFTGDVTTAAGSVSTTIADNAVSANKIANGAVTAAKLGSDVGFWSLTSGNAYRVAGNIGIGTNSPSEKLEVGGGIKIGNSTTTCDASSSGTIRWSGTAFEGCDGVSWSPLGSSTATSPTSFAFTDQSGVEYNTMTCSNVITLAGFSVPLFASVPASATGAPYLKINGAGTSTTTYGVVQAGNTLQACATTANSNLATVSVPVTVGSYTNTWNLTTGNKQPSPFSISNPASPASVNMAVDACASSNITGLTLATPVTVTINRGTVTALNINGAGWSAYTGSQTISNNQSLCVRITTTNTPSDTHNVTVTLGNGLTGVTPQSATYVVTNPSQDTTPDTFTLATVNNALAGTTITSSSINITGITGTVPVSITGDASAQFSIAGGSWVTSGNIQNNQQLRVRVTASTTSSATVSSTVTVGTSNVTWLVNTGAIRSSCLAHFNAGQTTSGAYNINPGGTLYHVYCDMTTDGGGWTLVTNGIGGTSASAAFDTVSGYNTTQVYLGVQETASFTMSRTVIDTLATTRVRLKNRGTYSTTVYQAPGWGNQPCQGQVVGSTYTDLALTQSVGHRGNTCTSSCSGSTVLGDPGWSNCCGSGTSRPGLYYGSAGQSGWSCGPTNGNSSGTVGGNGCGDVSFGFPGWDNPYTGLSSTSPNCSIEIWVK